MRKLNLFFQEVVKFLLWYLLFYVWIRYFVRDFWLAILLSLLSGGAVYASLFLIRLKKQNKTGLKLKEKEDAENMFLSLACEGNPMDFFVKLASKKHPDITKHKNYLVINHTQEKVKTVLYIDLSFVGLNSARFMEIYGKVKKEMATKIVICCKEIVERGLLSFCQNFEEKFVILDEYETYQKLYKFYDYFPKITHKYQAEKHLTFKDFVAYSFNKKRAKGYLLSALVLLISSLFVRMSIYYCIIASLLVIFAIISQFNSHYNPKTNEEVL